jgi:dihydrofolate reductase
MIRAIAAIDYKLGLANEKGIPWYLPNELRYFRDKTEEGTIFMGYGTYLEFTKPFHGRENFVATPEGQILHNGFTRVPDARSWLTAQADDVWVIGGAGLFTTTVDLMDELYLTEIEADFHCTKFFPPYKDSFELVSRSEPVTERGITYTFCIYRKK